MRLIKLLAYCLVGYILYEFWQGIKQTESEGDGGNDLDRALNRDQGRMMNMTGPGRGTMVETGGSDGMTASHLVGRGVVSR